MSGYSCPNTGINQSENANESHYSINSSYNTEKRWRNETNFGSLYVHIFLIWPRYHVKKSGKNYRHFENFVRNLLFFFRLISVIICAYPFAAQMGTLLFFSASLTLHLFVFLVGCGYLNGLFSSICCNFSSPSSATS